MHFSQSSYAQVTWTCTVLHPLRFALLAWGQTIAAKNAGCAQVLFHRSLLINHAVMAQVHSVLQRREGCQGAKLVPKQRQGSGGQLQQLEQRQEQREQCSSRHAHSLPLRCICLGPA